ncbi:hypothetical protein [Pontibacter saemangeumensis]|uniref:hypothetical protein n=1 Tax=Pontibacter saemangeumensis TaxID=1084525 RepID=UPI0031EBD192
MRYDGTAGANGTKAVGSAFGAGTTENGAVAPKNNHIGFKHGGLCFLLRVSDDVGRDLKL